VINFCLPVAELMAEVAGVVRPSASPLLVVVAASSLAVSTEAAGDCSARDSDPVLTAAAVWAWAGPGWLSGLLPWMCSANILNSFFAVKRIYFRL
jgi:hypothetical protein